jgi:hypothetical protein
MIKHLVHSHQGKLQTFDDFYRNDSKPIKFRSASNELIATNNSPSPTSPCSPNNNSYTFYNVFSDFKSSSTPDVVLEEDETEQDNNIIQQELTPSKPVFYLEDDHHPPSQSSSSSPHWPTLILNRFRHSNNHNVMVKQNSVNENQMNSTKLRKSDLTDSIIIPPKHRFLKRSQTINHTNGLTDKKSSSTTNDDFPELSLTSNSVKKHRSFVSLFHHFHHNNHHQNNIITRTKNPNISKSTETLHLDNHNDNQRPKLFKLKSIPPINDKSSPVNKSPSTPILPKLVSLFHRHHLSEHHKYRVGNLKARLHHRRNTAPKFQCQSSNELIKEIKQLEEQGYDQNDYIPFQRSVKPVIMKRVHTWHNTFDLRPVDQCLEY